MPDIAIVAGGFFVLAFVVHIVTAVLALRRFRTATPISYHEHPQSVTIIRPICGLDHFDALTLRSTFMLDDPGVELIFCCARENDPAVALVRALMAEYPDVRARLMIGDDRPTSNPKLNNVVKGWAAARTKWVILADSNVLMPPDYVARLLATFEGDVGLVCSPPLGSRPIGFWAELECAFLNTYQVRWQYAADAIGLGFAQGKSMLWRRADLNRAGGLQALGSEIAEDAAATKIVRAQGRRVRLVDRPFEQPLGPRRAAQVWDRQVRWARLRRATFSLYYVPEILTGSFAPMLSLAVAAAALHADVFSVLAVAVVVWYGIEAALAGIAGWHMSMWSPAAWLLRDLMIPILWIEGWAGDGFTWRGNDMTVADSQRAASAATGAKS
ncbi:MAG: ceramide glucosyltransferase [Hyphomicrobium sp.]